MKIHIAIFFNIFFLSFSQTIWSQGLTLFNDAYVHEIHFNNADTMVFINTEDYQSVHMTFDGFTVNNVGLKQKGNISASHLNNKMPFKIKTNKYVNGQEYDGIREFTLNNSFQDPSMMREKLTFDIADAMGFYALRTAYAKVFINNIYWGVYTIVEGKDEMYDHVFGNKDGDGIESTDWGDMCYYGANRSNYYHPAVGDRYIVDNGDATSTWTRLIPMLDAANNTPNANYVSVVSQELNINHFACYQALNVYLLNFDSYIGYVGNQVYFYDQTADLWQVIPWDFNASFGLWNTSNYGPANYPIMPSSIAGGCVASFINSNPTLKDVYLQTMCEFTTNIGDTVNFNNTIDQLKAKIKSAVYSDWRKEFTNSDFDNATAYGYHAHNGELVPAMKTFASDRFIKITQDLGALNYSCATGLQDTNAEQMPIKAFPNPADERINIVLNGENMANEFTYQIIGFDGCVLQKGTIEQGQIGIKNLPAGFYALRILVNHQQIAATKFAKTR
jgi:spore coat protein CotH